MTVDLTPEEIETLDISPVCDECGHRQVFHPAEPEYCIVEGCHCAY